MTSSSAALSLLALLLFAASTPLRLHAQFFNNYPPIIFPRVEFPPITIRGRPPINIPPFSLPPIVFGPGGVPPSGVPPVGSPLPNVINVTGQLCCTANGTCPGQALAGVPVTLACLSNNNATAIVARTVTNDNGTFTLNATLSLAGLVSTVSNLPTSIIPVCVVTIARSAVNATTCSVLGTTGSALNTTGGVLLAVVQFIGALVGQVLNGRVSAFVVI